MMNRVTVVVAVLLAATLPFESRGQATNDASKPPTALDREENNPAKAAVRVSEALKQQESEASRDISVGTHAGTIVVTGEVGSEAAAAKARATAEQAAEGTRVTTHIEVKEGAPPVAQTQAALLAGRVEDALKKDGRTSHLGVTVIVDDQQRIGLHGLVPTRESRTLAESVASKVTGPGRIRNHLVIPSG
jgi:osmotically-inducible protein OsmY